MPRSLIASKVRTYLFMTLGAPVLMLLGLIAFIACLACLFMGLWDERVVRAMLYINGAITIFMAGCALVVYRGAVLTDIARELDEHGSRGTATILESAYSGSLEAEHHKQWYELKLAVQPEDASSAPFTVDIEQMFNVAIVPLLAVGSVVPVKFSPDSEIFALVALEQAYVRLK
ncbi:hypothetical protein [Bordetella petrii]|uniref:hypothetical protein n=1 Tax=Bordetella petrii TaxID=94624 RepID=UPI0037319731